MSEASFKVFFPNQTLLFPSSDTPNSTKQVTSLMLARLLTCVWVWILTQSINKNWTGERPWMKALNNDCHSEESCPTDDVGVIVGMLLTRGDAGCHVMVCHIFWTLCSGSSYSRQINKYKPSSFRIMEPNCSSSSPAAEVLRASWALPIHPFLHYQPLKWPAGVSPPVMTMRRLHPVPQRLLPPLMRAQKSSASCAWVHSHLQPSRSSRAASVSSAPRWVNASRTCSSRTHQIQSGSNKLKTWPH